MRNPINRAAEGNVLSMIDRMRERLVFRVFLGLLIGCLTYLSVLVLSPIKQLSLSIAASSAVGGILACVFVRHIRKRTIGNIYYAPMHTPQYHFVALAAVLFLVFGLREVIRILGLPHNVFQTFVVSPLTLGFALGCGVCLCWLIALEGKHGPIYIRTAEQP